MSEKPNPSKSSAHENAWKGAAVATGLTVTLITTYLIDPSAGATVGALEVAGAFGAAALLSVTPQIKAAGRSVKREASLASKEITSNLREIKNAIKDIPNLRLSKIIKIAKGNSPNNP